MIARIQKDRIRRLRPHTIEREQFVAEFARWPREHSFERSAITLIEKVHKRFQPLRFLPKVPRWANQLLKRRPRGAPDSTDGQEPCSSKVGKCFFNIRPCSVLR